MTHEEPKWIGPATDYGPLAVFFGAYFFWGLIPATGALIVATLLALLASWIVRRTVPIDGKEVEVQLVPTSSAAEILKIEIDHTKGISANCHWPSLATGNRESQSPSGHWRHSRPTPCCHRDLL